jgi:4-amino-4-deoxy-L-arabinose transferase-like glycosyltransferase
MENSTYSSGYDGQHSQPLNFFERYYAVVVLLFAALIYVPAVFSPPSLMDDVDAVQAQIARNMLESGDFVSARLNGVLYLEKSPLIYWMMAGSFALFGVQDWAARIPVAFFAIGLALLTARMAAWAANPRVALGAGLVMATSLGLWLFTRIVIPDVILTFFVALALWAFLRVLDEDERNPRLWSNVMAASIATGLLLKGLIAALFPCAAAFLYLVFTNQLFAVHTWRRFRVLEGILILIGVAAPWHLAATLANPPYFDFTPRSLPGEYHGFFWFYFLNEHVFRFLNMRHPRDYNTVPRLAFWLFHFLWLFPWSTHIVAAFGNRVHQGNRHGRLLLLCLCWTGFLMAFFTFSTTQEYYSMPCYPALAILLGSAMNREGLAQRWARRLVGVVASLALLAILYILTSVWALPTPGDISQALATQSADAYTLSLGHMGDLTLPAFAYLKTPLLIAGAAFLIGAVGAWLPRQGSLLALATMSVLFLNAARVAMIGFDPYLASRPLAIALQAAPPGQWIADNQYYTWSSIFFYTNKTALLLNGRVNNLEYGSYAPGAPQVFLNDGAFQQRWASSNRYYLTVEKPSVERIAKLLPPGALIEVAQSGGKFLFTNLPLAAKQ